MKKIIFKYISFVVLFLNCLMVSAQQLPHYRNPFFNLTAMNPGTITIKEIPDIILNHRSQWIGYSGAPRISSLTGNYLFRDDMAGGISIINDSYGLTQKLNFALNYAYLLKTQKFYLSFGLSWTLTQYKLKGTEITIHDADDIIINQSLDDKTWKPDANAGVIVYNNDFYAGLSILQLFKTKYTFFQNSNEIPGLIQNHRHFIISGGYNIYGDQNNHKFSPFSNLYFASSTPFKFDLGLNYCFNSAFLSSLYLSKGDALVFSLGYKYERFYFSYSFDFVLSRIRNVSSGAHEITLGVYLKSNKKNSTNSNPMF